MLKCYRCEQIVLFCRKGKRNKYERLKLKEKKWGGKIMIMNKNKIECTRCNSTDLEVLEGKNSQSGEHVNDLWFRCRVCKKESPVFTNEVEIANNMLVQQKRFKQN